MSAAAPTGPAVLRAKTFGSNNVPATSMPVRKINPRDPQKGQWGGSSSSNGWAVRAKVTKIEEDWFEIVLTVSAAAGSRKVLSGEVTFHRAR
jgi:hypothetical protein